MHTSIEIICDELVHHFIHCRVGGVMVSVLASRAVDRVFEPWSGETKDYKISMCCFSDTHAALR